jgi:hypothetical protein
MIDRQLLGDVALAVLIAVPSAALARSERAPQPPTAAATAQQNSTIVLASAADRQIGLYR